MAGARLPENETGRLKALREYDVLDTPAEQAYDDIVGLAAYICETPTALVSLIDRDRQWFKARTGLNATQTPRDEAFCAHAILQPGQVMVVPDALRDERFDTNPLVTGEPNIRFYAGAPLITPTGEVLGTLCVIDSKPRQLSAEQAEVLRSLARQVMAQLEMRRSIGTLEAAVVRRETYVDQLEQHQRKLEASQAHLNEQSTTDTLTGVRNRRALDRSLDEEVARAGRQNLPLSLIMLDVDRFKQYNDSFGHPAGDEVLRGVAKVLQLSVRPYDIVARYGGEEFVAILPATGADGALMLAERCRRAIQRAVWPNRAVTASFGVTTLGAGGGAELLAAADKALYKAKETGRNRVVSG